MGWHTGFGTVATHKKPSMRHQSEGLIKRKGIKSLAQAETTAIGSIPTQPGASTSADLTTLSPISVMTTVAVASASA